MPNLFSTTRESTHAIFTRSPANLNRAAVTRKDRPRLEIYFRIGIFLKNVTVVSLLKLDRLFQRQLQPISSGRRRRERRGRGEESGDRVQKVQFKETEIGTASTAD